MSNIVTGMKTGTALEGAICNYENKLKEEIRWRINLMYSAVYSFIRLAEETRATGKDNTERLEEIENDIAKATDIVYQIANDYENLASEVYDDESRELLVRAFEVEAKGHASACEEILREAKEIMKVFKGDEWK